MKRQAGFTLIELIIVIVILGILAAYAVPKYMNIDKQARESVAKGVLGSVKAASDMVHALAVAQNRAIGTNTIDMGDGVNVSVNNGYADASNDGILKALADTSSLDITAGPPYIIGIKGAQNTQKCGVSYSLATSAGYAPTITSVSSPNYDCT